MGAESNPTREKKVCTACEDAPRWRVSGVCWRIREVGSCPAIGMQTVGRPASPGGSGSCLPPQPTHAGLKTLKGLGEKVFRVVTRRWYFDTQLKGKLGVVGRLKFFIVLLQYLLQVFLLFPHASSSHSSDFLLISSSSLNDGLLVHFNISAKL